MKGDKMKIDDYFTRPPAAIRNASITIDEFSRNLAKIRSRKTRTLPRAWTGIFKVKLTDGDVVCRFVSGKAKFLLAAKDKD
jgi:hypothetical protein